MDQDLYFSVYILNKPPFNPRLDGLGTFIFGLCVGCAYHSLKGLLECWQIHLWEALKGE
jgi:hypothetical protein